MNVRSVPTSIREHRVRTAGIATLTFFDRHVSGVARSGLAAIHGPSVYRRYAREGLGRGRTDWLKLADDFQRISDPTVRADWGKASAGEQWHVSGGTLPATRDCAALCRLAGAMLIASPKVSASLASSLRNVKDHTDRWLYYLKETSRTFEFDLEGEEVIDGRHSRVIGGSIDRLADESRRACLACAAEEL